MPNAEAVNPAAPYTNNMNRRYNNSANGSQRSYNNNNYNNGNGNFHRGWNNEWNKPQAADPNLEK